MPLGMLALLTVTVLASFAETHALTTYRRAVRGSHERYVWRTRYLLLASLVAVLATIVAVVDVLDGDTVFAAVWLAIAAMRILTMVLNRDDEDDDWFKRMGRRIRSAVRRAVAALAPRPGTAQPVPV